AAAAAREAVAAGRPFVALTPEEARELEAVAARIFPTDDTPGAREAGVIHFIDRAFDAFQADALPFAREGLSDLAVRARRADPASESFSALDEARQDAVLQEIEAEGFFGLIRFLTIAGMFALPEHGGNRDRLGWRLLGFEDRFVWRPPFGHYDAEVNGG
ncbi:MAG: gluconate 2-dehydrogenase subunit 3 family protein, partial [Gemmatimonadota bacterium]